MQYYATCHVHGDKVYCILTNDTDAYYLKVCYIFRTVFLMCCYLSGQTDRKRIFRKAVVRYLMFGIILIARSISVAVMKRFPTLDHIVEAGNFITLKSWLSYVLILLLPEMCIQHNKLSNIFKHWQTCILCQLKQKFIFQLCCLSQFLNFVSADSVKALLFAIYLYTIGQHTFTNKLLLCRLSILKYHLKLLSDSAKCKRRSVYLSTGFITKEEAIMFENIDCKYNKFWAPFMWANSVLVTARKEGMIQTDFGLRMVIEVWIFKYKRSDNCHSLDYT